jgi:long-chain acyl-CoA synthetase
MAEKVGSFLLNNKMEFNETEHNMKFIGIFSKNRYEWVVADLACVLYGLTIVPLYDTLGIDNLTYCL